MTAPIAKKDPRTFELHGDTRTDDYGWLRDRSNPEVIAYLEAENAYADELTNHLAPLREALYAEMLGRIKQTDSNPPYRKGAHWYYSRTEEGKQYPIYARKSGSLEAPEEVLLDVNHLADGHEFMALGAVAVSDDGNLLAYTTDDTGYRQYRLHVKDLRSGETLPDMAERVGAVEWATDNATLIYAVENDAKRQCCVYRKKLGEPEVLIYEDTDELYDVWVERSRSGAVLFIISDSKTTSEVRMLRASDPHAEPVVIAPRRDEHQYYAEHHGDRLYILTNDTGINSRLVSAPLDAPFEANWVEVIPHRQPVRLERVDAFREHLVVTQRENGLTQLRIIDLRTNDAHFIAFDEPAYALAPSHNEEFDTNVFRFAYESLVMPKSIYDYDMDSRSRTLLKRTEVLGGFDPANYRSERIFATASDGARVPIALVHHKDVDPRGVNPLELYAYGSYGVSIPTNFSSSRLSLLDRGFVFAIAHIRGGGELGREWYDDGRMTKKTNTFTDFIAAAEHLIAERYTSPDKLVIQGGSAGGLLVGAVVNMRPELFKAALAYVPFVDVLNTMLDATLPLTTQEYIEWGNPNEREAYFCIKSYDPYDNVRRQAYPAMLVRTSLNDSQVGYWEAAKWVAKLRAHKTDDNPLLLVVNMGAGHGGSSGRYDKLREDAFDIAWMMSEVESEKSKVKSRK